MNFWGNLQRQLQIFTIWRAAWPVEVVTAAVLFFAGLVVVGLLLPWPRQRGDAWRLAGSSVAAADRRAAVDRQPAAGDERHRFQGGSLLLISGAVCFMGGGTRERGDRITVATGSVGIRGAAALRRRRCPYSGRRLCSARIGVRLRSTSPPISRPAQACPAPSSATPITPTRRSSGIYARWPMRRRRRSISLQRRADE